MCINDSNIKLNDETYKIILNTKGSKSDIDGELLEFLEYVEESNTEIAQKARGNLVKNIHKRVMKVKNDASVEVEFMTLLERDREKIEEGKLEGIELTKKVFKLNNKGISVREIAKECEISEEEVLKILE